MKFSLNELLAVALVQSLAATPINAGPAQESNAALSSGDYATTLNLLRPLAEKGDAVAQRNLGIIYDNGFGVPKNGSEAAKWYLLAANAGDAQAQANLGSMYLSGRGPIDFDEALKWNRLAAKQGNPAGQSNLATMYQLWEKILPKDAEASPLRLYQLAANQGYAEAEHELGDIYMYGLGVHLDYVEAAKWYRRAADQGDARAQLILAGMYARGLGVPRDNAEAAKWYRAVDDGDKGGASHVLGGGNENTLGELTPWVRQSAWLALGNIYENGIGVPQDYVEAVKWYRRGADQYDIEAQLSLGRMYENGHGLPQDYEQAENLYFSAALHDYAPAQLALGRLYVNGHGVRQDDVFAYAWLSLSAAQGSAEASQELDVRKALMTPAKIAEAQEMAATFKREIEHVHWREIRD